MNSRIQNAIYCQEEAKLEAAAAMLMRLAAARNLRENNGYLAAHYAACANWHAKMAARSHNEAAYWLTLILEDAP